MRATGFTHVSIHAYDLEESLRFYTEVFGLRRVPSPDFEHPVVWLEIGDLQLHLFLRDTPPPDFHHIGIDVDDFDGFLERAEELGVLDDAARGSMRVLPSGEVQMYIHDPAGNRVEVDWPDASALAPETQARLRRLEDAQPQDAENRLARLYMEPAQKV